MTDINELDDNLLSPAELGQITHGYKPDSSNSNIADLTRFLTNHGQRKLKGEKTNFVDQHYGVNWQIEERDLPKLYDICEKIRLDKAQYGLSVRQDDNAKMWFDIDIKLSANEHISENESLWQRIAIEFSKAIVADGVFKADEEHKVYMLITNRTKVTESNGIYKDGIHIYTSIQASSAYRRYITKKIATKKYAELIFESRKIMSKIKNLDTAIDGNSCNVLPLLLGATKRDGTLYKIAKLYCCEYIGNDFDSCVAVDNFSNINLVATFSTSSYTPPETQYMIRTIHLTSKLEEELSLTAQENYLQKDDNENLEDSIDIISQNDPRCRELANMIELLSKTRSSDYSSWNKIMIALARYDNKYKCIAKKFSANWTHFDPHKFEEDWAKAMRQCSAYPMYNTGMLSNMAREDNPEEYRKLISKNMFGVALKHMFEAMEYQSAKSATLKHFPIADIIATAFPDKYIATPKVNASGQKMADDTDVNYWVYSTKDSDVYSDGNACKYIALPSTNMISVWISRSFPSILKNLRRYALTQKAKESDPDSQEIKWDVFLHILGKTHANINCHSFKTCVIREFAAISTKLNFLEKMDKNPDVMGIYDGLLEMGIKPNIVRGLSEHKISKFAPSKFVLFDPENPMILKTIQIYLDFCPIEHFDVICYILLYQSQVMTNHKKDLIMINLWGHGRNGKSVIIEWLYNALGNYETNGYAYKFKTTVLTEKDVQSSAPRSDLMPMYRSRYMGSSESGRCPRIYPENLKNMLSGENTSNRELHTRNTTGCINAVMMVATNDPMEFALVDKRRRAYDIDYGSSRRFKIYHALMTYVDSPDKSNRFEKQNDHKIFKSVIQDKEYGGALLSLLSIVYPLLTMIHNNNVSSIVSPNIDKQTEIHLDKQDVVSKFIKSSCVISDEYEMSIDTMVDAFIDGYKEEQVIHNREKIQSVLIGHTLTKKYMVQRDTKYYAVGIRCIAVGEELRDGEKMIEDNNKWVFNHYSDFVLPEGLKLPFDNKIKPTLDAKDFARQLYDLYNKCLAEYEAKHS